MCLRNETVIRVQGIWVLRWVPLRAGRPFANDFPPLQTDDLKVASQRVQTDR